MLKLYYLVKQKCFGGKGKARQFIFILTLSFLSTLLLAASGSWDLGKYKFVNGQSSPPLLKILKSESSLNSYDFVGGVGGVAFAGVALPDSRIGLNIISLQYNPKKQDGKRLEVRIEDQTFALTIHDWQLLPIARYADSKYNACVSLFGPKTNKNKYDIVYHPALKDTLLGMRLLQADILLFDLAETWQLPSMNGKTILGAGENAPTGLDRKSALEIQSVFKKANFQSWVMTDDEVKVRILRDGKKMSLSGEPYYYFWTSNFSEYVQNRNALVAQANQLRRTGKVSEHNKLVKQINAMKPRVTQVKSLTNGLKQKYNALYRFNPAVFDAASNTMRFAALFRLVKKQNPGNWKRFLNQLKKIKITPNVETPTQWNKNS